MASKVLTRAQVAEALAQRRRAVKDAEAEAERRRRLRTERKRPASPDPDLHPSRPRARRVPGGSRNENYRVTVDGQELLLQSPAPLDTFHLDRDAYPHPKCPPEPRCLHQPDVLDHFSGKSWSLRLRYRDPDDKFYLRDFVVRRCRRDESPGRAPEIPGESAPDGGTALGVGSGTPRVPRRGLRVRTGFHLAWPPCSGDPWLVGTAAA